MIIDFDQFIAVFVFLAIGKLFIWLLQINGLIKPVVKKRAILDELITCDLCLGFWVYLAMYLLITNSLTITNILNGVSVAALSTLSTHLVSIGWQAKFGVTYID